MTDATTVANVKFVSNADLRKAYKEAHAAGENIHQLAEKLGVKPGSLTVRISGIRKDLKEKNLTEDQITMLFPPLARKGGSGRKGDRDAFLDSLVEEITAPIADELDAPSVPADVPVE